MPANNDQFLFSNSAISCLPINANECAAVQKLDTAAIPNSIPAKYYIVFQMNDGTYYKWEYATSVGRDTEFTTAKNAITTTL